MKKLVLFLAIISSLLLNPSCRSSFEKLRVEGTPEQQYSKALEYYELKKYAKARILFENIISVYAGRPESEKLYYYYANTIYNMREYANAAYYYRRFANTFTNSEFREDAEYMYAYCYYRLSPSYRLDQSHTVTAIDAFQLFINTYPESKRVPEVNGLMESMRQKMELKAFDEGELYFKVRNYQSAVISLENTLRDFPETDRAEEIRYLIAKSSYLLADNSILSKQEERFGQAKRNAEEFIRKHNSSKYAKEVKSIIKESNSKLKELSK